MKKIKLSRCFELILPFAIFAVCFLACCMINYSDGDDAFFIKTVSEHPSFFDFTSYLTKTMNGRITATATLWVIFSNSIWLWRFLNAVVMTFFTIIISKLSKIILCKEKIELNHLLFAAASFAIIGIGIMGYSCLWITGSVNYLWPCVAGLASLTPFLESVFTKNYSIKKLSYVFSSLLGIYACLAQEQIGAVVICSCLIILIYNGIQTHKINPYQVITFSLMLISFILLISSPANAARSTKEILRWLPEYATFTFFDKFFITLQWLLHFTANSLRYILVFLWGCMGVKFFKDKKKILCMLCIIMILVSLIPLLGIDSITNLGLNELDMTKKVENAPQFEDLTLQQLIAGIWWIFCIVATFILILLSGNNQTLKISQQLIYLAAFASAAIMLFSPTIYASGERTLFITATLLVLLSSTFINFNAQKKSTVFVYILSLISVAGIQLYDNIDYILKMI